jgi:putative component of membrane protein insertase Oxa1/YidC/SpoIIIJ protein YidD
MRYRFEKERSCRLHAATCTHQRIKVVIQMNGKHGGMKDAVQLHERLLQCSPFALFGRTGTPRQLLISLE